jgi:hypothetical protein
MFIAKGAVFFKRNSAGVLTLVFIGRVVSALANLTRQYDQISHLFNLLLK